MAYSAPTLFATGLNNPQDMDSDSAGNLYVADSGTNSVLKITPAGAYSRVVESPNVSSVTVDSSGNIYTVSSSTNVVYKNGAVYAQSPLIQNPTSLSLDASNNLYILCAGTNSVVLVGVH